MGFNGGIRNVSIYRVDMNEYIYTKTGEHACIYTRSLSLSSSLSLSLSLCLCVDGKWLQLSGTWVRNSKAGRGNGVKR